MYTGETDHQDLQYFVKMCDPHLFGCKKSVGAAVSPHFFDNIGGAITSMAAVTSMSITGSQFMKAVDSVHLQSKVIRIDTVGKRQSYRCVISAPLDEMCIIH